MTSTTIRAWLRFLKWHCLPSEHKSNLRRWYADGGDLAFRYNYGLNKNSVVLDLGGYEGQWASEMHSKFGCCIYIFEPVRMYYERIMKNLGDNEDIFKFQFGLGANNRKEKIYLAEYASSTYGNSGVCEEITIVNASEWIQESKLDRIDVIKINIEGGEYELLNHLIAADLVSKFDNIQIQFHKISKYSYQEMVKIQQALSKTHELTFQYKLVWENWKKKLPTNQSTES